MEMGFLMTFLAAYIGSQEKTFKQKILPLTISGIVVYILGRLWGEEADPIMLAIYVAGSLFMGGWGHIAQNYGNKKISLKFWKSKKQMKNKKHFVDKNYVLLAKHFSPL